MNENGWIKLHRKILRSESLKKFTRIEKFNFLELLLMANYEDETKIIAGEVVTIPRGGVLLDIKELSKEWEIEYQVLVNFIKKLIKENIITKESKKHRAVIVFINYEKYQGENLDNTLTKLSQNFDKTLTKVSHISQGVTENLDNTLTKLSQNFDKTLTKVGVTLYKRNKENKNKEINIGLVADATLIPDTPRPDESNSKQISKLEYTEPSKAPKKPRKHFLDKYKDRVYSENDWQYQYALEFEKILKIKIPNQQNINRQEGSRLMDHLGESRGYSRDEIRETLLFFLNFNKFPSECIDSVNSFNQYFKTLNNKRIQKNDGYDKIRTDSAIDEFFGNK